MNRGKPITFGGGPSVRAARNLTIEGVTQISAVFTCQGDGTGGDTNWTATPRTAGNSFAATTPNGYECSVIASDLTPGTVYDVSVNINGGGAITGVFTTDTESVVVESGLQPLRRRSF